MPTIAIGSGQSDTGGSVAGDGSVEATIIKEVRLVGVSWMNRGRLSRCMDEQVHDESRGTAIRFRVVRHNFSLYMWTYWMLSRLIIQSPALIHYDISFIQDCSGSDAMT